MKHKRSILNLKIVYLLTVCHTVWTECIREENSESLRLVHILFRHGERTNMKYGIYPKDPHINETYFPYGMGELTNKGKKTEYKLGKAIRKRYETFLGKSYWPGLVEAWSSNTNRTKASLMVLLAGLFPPTGEEAFEDGLIWQPVPFNLPPQKEDKIFFGINDCPRYHKEYKDHVESKKMMETFNKYQELFQYLSQETGWNVTDFEHIFKVYIGLKVEEEWGLELPSWTKKVFPQPLEAIAPQVYVSLTATTTMRRIISGYLLKKIIDDTKSKINNEDFMCKRKMFLYSGHEFNLGALLTILDLFDTPHIPPYGSYIVLEVHTINGVNGIKIFYQNYETSNGEPRLLTLPGCESFCEFRKFVSLLEEYLPTHDSCGTERTCKSSV